jgi:hypothetical protein
MEGVIYDVRDALRSLRRRPGFAVGHDREGGDAFSPWAVESRRGGLPAHRPARVGSRAGWCKRDRRIWESPGDDDRSGRRRPDCIRAPSETTLQAKA